MNQNDTQSPPPPPPPPPPHSSGHGHQAESKEDKRPWRENIEALTMAVVMAVLLKYFVVEAYKIPTGSMQPTLMGLQIDAKNGVFDRIIADKLSYHFRDPERFEVAIFKYPLDRSRNYIKRIWGLPGEHLLIRDGDIFRRDDETQPWEIVRRPKPIQRETLKQLTTKGEWRGEAGGEGWNFIEDGFDATQPGRAIFPQTKSSIRDNYTDGYPPELIGKVRRRGRGSGTNDVADLRVAGTVTASQECTQVTVQLFEGPRTYEARFPGPAAPEGSKPSMRIIDSSGEIDERVVEASEPWRLRAGEEVPIAAQNLDDLLELEIDGDVLIEVEVPKASEQRARVAVQLEGGGARLRDLNVFRDIFYTTSHATMSQWEIPEDSYVMLGDNTQDSADGREWQLARRELTSGPRAGEIIRGNMREGKNPARVPGGPNGPEVFFRDLYGERNHFLESESRPLSPERNPFVPRQLITGRALVVFWPIKPSLGIYRLKWIH